MKKNTHPEKHDVTARCTCGFTFLTRSTEPELNLTLCSNCHPFYTNTQKFVDTTGRIEKFNKKFKGSKAA